MKILTCHFTQEKNEDESGVLQGALDIIDEFVHAFGTNANKNINIQSKKVKLLIHSGNQAYDIPASDVLSKNFYDLALNVHSRFFEDNDIEYANIMTMKITRLSKLDTIEPWIQNERESQETLEILLQCLTIYYDDVKIIDVIKIQLLGFTDILLEYTLQKFITTKMSHSQENKF